MTSYRVAAKHAVLDNEPGSVFEADIPEVQAERLLACGALELASGEPATPAPKAPPADEPDSPEE